MELMQRLGNNPNEEYVDKYIEQILKHPGSCDNVWIPTSYGFPTLEKHKKIADFWAGSVDKFRKNGISVSMQISNTLGHGAQITGDCTGLVYEGSPAENIVGFDGVKANNCFCWRGENFRKYVLESTSYYIEGIKPDVVWIDDDFRVINHSPVKYGCFCDNCMRLFNLRHSSNVSREELAEKVLYGDIRWREYFVEFLREGLYDFTYRISEMIHSISPDTVLAYQSCANGGYAGEGCNYIYDAMKDTTGHIPYSRPGGGIAAYIDHDPNLLIEKSLYINRQNSTLPEYVKRKCPEVENLPFVVFGKTPAGTAFESSLYFANGNTDMSYSMLMHEKEPFEWHAQEFELLARHRKYWEAMSECNENSYQAGMQYFLSSNMWKKKLSSDEGFDEVNYEPVTAIMPFIRDGFPIAYDKNDDSLIILHPEAAMRVTDDDVEYLMGKNVITDAETLKMFTQRGFDFGVNVTEIDSADAMRMNSRFTENKLNPNGLETHVQSYYSKGRNGVFAILPLQNADIEILSFYSTSHNIKRYCDSDDMPYGVAEAVITTSKGGKWGVFGYSPWKPVMPFYKREHILDTADYISGNALCARIVSPVQAVLLPRKDEAGKTVCVSVVNCTIGESGDIKLRIRNPKGENFSFMSQYNGEAELAFTKDGDDYIVTMPSLNAWSTGTVFIK